jgi:hypothetical protein
VTVVAEDSELCSNLTVPVMAESPRRTATIDGGEAPGGDGLVRF